MPPRFTELVDLLYEKQDSLGLKAWSAFASDAKVKDTAGFNACVAQKRGTERIDAGLRLAESLKLTGTPSVMINGWLLRTPPSEGDMENQVEAFLKTRRPFSF